MSDANVRPHAALGRLPPRVRIAPSPTGDPHVGTAYIGLFNYVFARKHGGKFVLRVEDTDQTRSTRSSELAIYDALRWTGLSWDEGPDVGGPFGPYRQSERTAIYREHAERLLREGAAYRCFCTPERLEAVRKEREARGDANRGYDGHCRALAPGEATRRAEAGEPHVLRLAVPREGETVVVDELRGELRFANDGIDDQVLLKSDGFPTYHLANVVDDHLMEITHVIRGEDWITSTPKHVLLYRAFGWEAPLFFHLSLLRNPDKSKLSKRKNPVSIVHYRDLGYLPSTFLNFLGTLGFSMPGDVERFTVEEMVAAFDWSRVGTGGPVFDVRKLDAWNGDDIRALTPEALLGRIEADVLTHERLLQIVTLAQQRLPRLDEFVPYAAFFFGGSVDLDAVIGGVRSKTRSRKDTIKIVKAVIEEIEKDPEARAFTAAGLEAFCHRFAERHGLSNKELFTLLRIGATGRNATPPLFETLAVLGKDRVRLRLRDLEARLTREPDWPTG